MKLRLLIVLIVMLALIVSGCTACKRSGIIPTATPTPAVYPEVGITVLDTSVADNDWSPDGSLIAYAKRDALDGYFDIWVTKPDGTGKTKLTDSRITPDKNCGGVSWHPSGDYIAFTAENEDVPASADSMAEPGIGLNCNLWVMRSDGSMAWKLSRLATSATTPKGVIHPQFSNDGTRIFWSEATGSYGEGKYHEWGEWRLMIGEFVVEDGVPSIKSVKMMEPGTEQSFYESHDWSRDDGSVLFCGNLEQDQPLNGIDIYRYNVTTWTLKRMTNSPDDWDEHAHYSPDGKTIAWMSGKGLNVTFPSVKWPDWAGYVKTELWMMGSDGSRQRKVTTFNEPGTPDYEWFHNAFFDTDRVIVSDNSWSPDGSKMAVTIAYEGKDSLQCGSMRSVLVVMSLDNRNG